MTANGPQILVINSGSSSLKFSVLEVQSESVLVSGIAERLGTTEALLKLSDPDAKKMEEPLPDAYHRAALRRVTDHLRGWLSNEIEAVGYRIVHGGEYFRGAVIIDDEVVRCIEELSDLAPLHNPPAAQGIRLASELFYGKPQVAVFDTAFHQTLPPRAFHYAIPARFYSQYRVRRYGFHGTSNQYVTEELARLLERPVSELQLLTAHLGNGCSATAVKQGRSVETRMSLKVLRPEINEQWNRVHGRGNQGRITEETGLACFVVPTNEELMIARQTATLVLRKPNRTLREQDAGQTL